VNRSKLEKALKRQKSAVCLRFLCRRFHFFAVFRESAKIAFVQAQKKLASCQKKTNFEDALVKNLENVRETLLNANQIHLERDLQQCCPFLQC
jgi:hypothetical protein